MSFKLPTLPAALPLSTSPYIITTPSDIPFSTPDCQRDNWRISGWFAPSEKYLQYQTFIWRDPSESLFLLKTAQEMKGGSGESGRREKDREREMGKEKEKEGKAKKKISLSDYRRKGVAAPAQADGIGEARGVAAQNATSQAMEGIKQANVGKEEVERATKELESNNAEVSDTGDRNTAPTEHAPSRTRTDQDEAESARQTLVHKRRSQEDVDAGDVLKTSKKSRTTGSDESQVAGDLAQKETQEETATKAMAKPRNLSTTKPPKSSTQSKQTAQSLPTWRARGTGVPRDTFALPTPPHHEENKPAKGHEPPRWLSSRSRNGPSIPPRLPNDFRKVDRTPPRPAAASQTTYPSQMLSPPPSTSSPDSVRMSFNYSSNSSVGDEPVEEKRPVVAQKGVARKRQPGTDHDASIEEVQLTKTSFDETAHRSAASTYGRDATMEDSASSSEENLLVKLKFSKALRKDVQRILQLKPSPRSLPPHTTKRESSLEDKDSTMDDAIRERKNKVSKSARDPDSTQLPPPKRLKPNPTTARATPRTPLPHSPPAQPTPSSSTLHRKIITPKKDKEPLKKSSVSSLFQTYKDHQSTPRPLPPPAQAATAATTLTPTPAAPNTTISPPSTHRPTQPTITTNHHQDTHKRLASLGRTLKHKFQRSIHSLSSHSSLSTSSKPQPPTSNHHLAALHGLESLLTFLLSFLHRSRSFSASDSDAERKKAEYLVTSLGSMQIFGEEVLGQCASWPHLRGFGEVMLGACAGGVVVAAGDLAAGVGGDGEAAETREQLARLAKAISDTTRHAHNAARLLPFDVLEREYPLAAKEVEKGALLGGVGLPPLVAVRMGRVFLEEYCTKNESRGLGWEAVLGTGDVEGL